jgi:hypothetical protein
MVGVRRSLDRGSGCVCQLLWCAHAQEICARGATQTMQVHSQTEICSNCLRCMFGTVTFSAG